MVLEETGNLEGPSFSKRMGESEEEKLLTDITQDYLIKKSSYSEKFKTHAKSLIYALGFLSSSIERYNKIKAGSDKNKDLYLKNIANCISDFLEEIEKTGYLKNIKIAPVVQKAAKIATEWTTSNTAKEIIQNMPTKPPPSSVTNKTIAPLPVSGKKENISEKVSKLFGRKKKEDSEGVKELTAAINVLFQNPQPTVKLMLDAYRRLQSAAEKSKTKDERLLLIGLWNVLGETLIKNTRTVKPSDIINSSEYRKANQAITKMKTKIK